jgi:predicted kinase
MSRPTLIIVLGLPATGKTQLAHTIAAEFRLPLISKDDIKEIIFDGLGWRDRDWSKKAGRTTFALIDYILEGQLKAGNSIIVESPYDPTFQNDKLQRWQQLYHFNALQILCYAEGSVLLDRFIQRSNSAQRHPGHVDAGNVDEFREHLLKGKAELLDIQGSVIEVDTTDFTKVDEANIFSQIRQALMV